jgi:outer membrane lipoprotein SlyB
MASSRTHPILIAAGVAVLLFSLLGAAALTGVLPAGNTKSAEPGAFAQKEAAPSSAPARGPAPSTSRAAAPAATVPVAAACGTCGKIESIRAVEVKGESSGLGAVTGGIVGGVVGNQFGHGGTKTLLTVGGAAGGAFAGDAVEKHVKKHTAWQVTVRLDDGSARTLSQAAQPPFAIGDRVRILDGKLLERAA